MLRTPKVDVSKLVEGAGGAEVLAKATGHVQMGVKVKAPSSEDTGAKVEAAESDAEEEAPKKGMSSLVRVHPLLSLPLGCSSPNPFAFADAKKAAPAKSDK